MAGFTKLYSSIVYSTIWREPDHMRILWLTMLALADKDGIVGASIPGLAHVARISLKNCEEGLAKFLSPDPYSRSQEQEGRRIEEVTGGWRLINYASYRGQSTAEKIREKGRNRQRLYMQRLAEKKEETSRDVSDAHTYASASSSASSLRSEAKEEAALNNSLDSHDLFPSLANIVLTTHTNKVKKTKTKKDIAKERIAKGTPTWDAYSEAYKKRYGAYPVRNARVNALCVQLVDLLGAEDAPRVASHYLESNNGFYAGAGYSLVILVRDAGKLHTEWKTGRHSTQTQARETDRRQTTGDAVNSYIAKLEAKEKAKKENE